MFQVLHSSAGAGKTHRLVRHFLELALAGDAPDGYRRVLALTFTNKAAGEMRERILEYLEGLERNDEPTGALADVLENLTRNGTSTDTIRLRAARTRKHMLHHWPQLAVSTIDAFTRRVIMPFARDLRLDSELRMTTEEEDYRDLAVDRLLQEAGDEPALTRLLLAVCEDLVEQERDWRADKPLRTLSKELTREGALVHLAELRALGNDHFLHVQQRLRESTRGFRDRLRALGRGVLEAIHEEGITPSDLYYGKNGPYGYLRALAEFDDWIDERANTTKALEKDKWASDKASPDVRDAVDRLGPMFREAIRTVEDLRGNGELGRHALACAVLNDLLPSAALHLLDERLESVKHAEGVTFFSDLVKRVSTIAQREPTAFLYERLGERYEHFLIDEFQDTSLLQWQALLPLITNALSTGGSALLVGDAKQAIYRWRNGEARQFTQLPALFAKGMMVDGDQHESILQRSYRSVEPLIENRRSAQGIIRFNNDLFDAMRATLPEELQDAYRDQRQQATRTDEGYIRIACSSGAGDAPEEDQAADPFPHEFTGRAVEECLADGADPGDIAVLVRSGAQGRGMAAHLSALGYDVVSPDGLSIGGDINVRTIVSVLTWVHHPDDVSAARAVQYLCMRTMPGDVATALARPGHWMREWQRPHGQVHARKPLVALLHAIVHALELDPASDAYVLGLLEEAHRFAVEHGDASLLFLEHWSRVAGNRSIAGAENPGAVRVMTVHKSKGLQFPVVIVPYADMATRNAREPLWVDPRSAVPELPAALVKPSRTLATIGVPEVMEEADLASLDRLDLLYVAFTRPELRLYAAFDGARKTGLGADVRAALGMGPGDVHEIGTRHPLNVRSQVVAARTKTLAPTTSPGPVPLAMRCEAPESWDPADPDPFRSRGRALHAILARVRVPDDLDDAIERERDVWDISATEAGELRARLSVLLRRHELAPFFGPDLVIRTESALIDHDGHVRRPDRICTEGSVTRVLDIKTGAPRSDHHAQVALYMRMLRDLGIGEVSGHLLYLEEGRIEPVDERSVPPPP